MIGQCHAVAVALDTDLADYATPDRLHEQIAAAFARRLAGRTNSNRWRPAGSAVTSTSDAGKPAGLRARAILCHPQFWKAAWAAVAVGGTTAVARSSGLPARTRSCSALPMSCRRHDPRTRSSTRANVRPGYSVVTCSGKIVVTSRHHDVDGRSGIPAAYPIR